MPIVWYALFDYEYNKEYFLKDPKTYSIGINHKCFGTYKFWYWLSNGII
jgi:hypothetical protein